MTKLPVYFNCYFFDKGNDKTVYTYKIGASQVTQHPFQLFRLLNKDAGNWQNLSVYASVNDALKVLLKEFFTQELSDEIDHGQVTVNPARIVEKIDRGERSVSIYGATNNEAFRLEIDIDFEALVEGMPK